MPQDGFAVSEEMFVYNFHLNIKKIRFAGIQQNQTVRLVFDDLPAKLRTNGAAAPGDQNGFVIEIIPDIPHIKLHRRASQKILIADIPEQLHADAAVNQVADTRQYFIVQITLLAGFHNPADPIAAGGRHRNEDLMNRFPLQNFRQAVNRPEDSDPVNCPALFLLVVIDQTDHFIIQFIVIIDFA